MSLTGKQLNYLRGLAHHRNVVVAVGGPGLTQSVVNDIDRALAHHELVKIKLAISDRDERRSCVTRICKRTAAHSVQQIGRVAVVYRAAKDPKIVLPGIFNAEC
ncbi:MAG: ribosome assembly RNA-binding protein YhbY [Gammaproteobacteria bacterium]|nr:ribosome assembly RNA-binding protein YhbY [Gammaproteobacteria bacterium]